VIETPIFFVGSFRNCSETPKQTDFFLFRDKDQNQTDANPFWQPVVRPIKGLGFGVWWKVAVLKLCFFTLISGS
jgi:hypothetical protein